MHGECPCVDSTHANDAPVIPVAMETCHLAAAYSCYRDNISRGVTYRLAVIDIITLQKKEVLQCAEGTLCPERCDASI